MLKRNGRISLKKQQPTTPIAPHPAISRTAKVWSILIAIGSASGFFSLAEKAWTIAVEHTKPDVRPLNLSSDPFSLPLVIKNQSSVFAMTDITWVCGIDSVGDPRGGSMADFGIIPGRKTNTPANISPGKSLLVRCPIGGAGGSDATIVPIVKYKTLGIAREYNESSLTWLSKATPPQWIEGRPLR